MSAVKNRKARPLIIAALAGGLVAGVVTGASVTDGFTAAAERGGTAKKGGTAKQKSGTSEKVAIAGMKAKNGERCEPVDRVTPILIREGWVGTPEKAAWRNGGSTQPQHQFTFTQTNAARGMLTGKLPSLPSIQGKARAQINKKNKEQESTSAMEGFELELSASISTAETVTYTVPARSIFVAKRGIWKQTWAIKRYQRWSNCQERWSHVGNYTGVGIMNYTSSKALYR
ncbi:hypothetical protein OHB04_37335 [Streptomyces sp. NBC_01775]|uniref:hypothetical protein n=1 Tax=Streptomyces sp. NBC_01775 TaxID=2975939 RepID=UPI002DDADC6F|nr:hypothetical protein [Streptomyces sp. NBC_01775]WSB80820.1 hypothetical protein OHB04_37335 [Streptomyces sp. NBC_01775]